MADESERKNERQAEPETTTRGKNRPVGVQVVFTPINRKKSFNNVDQHRIIKECRKLLNYERFSHQVRSDGTLMVSCSSASGAQELLSVRRFAGIRASTCVLNWYSRRLGRIRDVPLNYTDRLLMESLRDYGVVSVRRQCAYRVKGSSNETRKRFTNSVILHFRADRHMPSHVYLGFNRFRVDRYFGAPTQCYNCQRYGHTSEFCHHSMRCKNCAGPHSHKECRSPAHLLCANCNGHHAATYSGCPCKAAAYAVIKRERTLTRQ
ncbi:hypothetical protein HPB52_008822 [Rhipicephalus sanguineus]|uniref:Tick transposon n=1 Tax=Rhipicephalus sanguineus TaxID=34632 RepID=A0A9D4T8X5_RHISA|nr:hypothetical protein HPB52_008822 [Rhipicephalus sanguineus]